MSKNIAIVGGGPSALFAIMACHDLGIVPDVYVKELSVQSGAFWFHWLPPSFVSKFRSHEITVRFYGTREEYIHKQWKAFSIPSSYQSSFPELEYAERGFNPKEVMSSIFSTPSLFSIKFVQKMMTDSDLTDLKENYDFVFHTFPTERSELLNHNRFVFFPIVFRELGPSITPEVIYNGKADSEVVRTSRLWGMEYKELTPLKEKPFSGVKSAGVGEFCVISRDLVPFDGSVNFCQLSDFIVPVGRLARLDRKCLSHEAYNLVRGYIENAS